MNRVKTYINRSLIDRIVTLLLMALASLAGTPASAQQDLQIVIGERVINEFGEEQIVWMQPSEFLVQAMTPHFIELKPNVVTSTIGFRDDQKANSLFGCVDPFFNTLILFCDIAITFGDVLDDGGHVHDDPAVPRPLGVFDPMVGNSGADGFLAAEYMAPEYGGIWEFTINGTAPNGTPAQPLTLTIFIRQPGLHPLPPSPLYTLIGQNNSHPENHFGTTVFSETLTRMATRYSAMFPGQILSFNDLSLRLGGQFDICAVAADSNSCSVDTPWSRPRGSHRYGVAADVQVPATKAERSWLWSEIHTVENFDYFLDETDHWHIRHTRPIP